jgi:transposase
MRRDTKEVLAELVGKLKEKLDPKKLAATSGGEEHPRGELRPNLDRLTVGVDLGDQWSNYCILGLEGETLAEGQLRTTQEDIAEFFQAWNAARVVFEVGTHSPWVQEVICGCGHEVLVANPRLMEGSKRRKRKNDRIDANKLARLGRVDPKSLHPIQHRSREVRQVKGVGPITALAYVLTLENPGRFVKSRDVGPYLGLVPKQEDSGESQPQLGISKTGDTMLRKLLVGSAHYILGPFGPDTDLRRYGLRLCERGGKNAKKRAAVAVARKLAVLLHCLWVSGEVYEPLCQGMSATIAPAAAA